MREGCRVLPANAREFPGSQRNGCHRICRNVRTTREAAIAMELIGIPIIVMFGQMIAENVEAVGMSQGLDVLRFE